MATQSPITPPLPASPEAPSETPAASSRKELYPNLLTFEEMEEIDARLTDAVFARREATRKAEKQASE